MKNSNTVRVPATPLVPPAPPESSTMKKITNQKNWTPVVTGKSLPHCS